MEASDRPKKAQPFSTCRKVQNGNSRVHQDLSNSQVDPKNQVKLLPHHCNSPRLARDALVLGPSSALNGDPSPISSVQNSFSNSPTTKYFTPINSSSNFVQKELLPPKDRQQGPSTSQSGPCLRNGAMEIWWISPLPL